MDFLKKAAGELQAAGNQQGGEQHQQPTEGSTQQAQSGGGGLGGLLGGLQNQVNSAAGGGAEGEKNEDYLDKGVDLVQEKLLGQGKQDNESAIEQAKDEQISDFIRKQYKSTTGKDFPVQDKPTTFDSSAD